MVSLDVPCGYDQSHGSQTEGPSLSCYQASSVRFNSSVCRRVVEARHLILTNRNNKQTVSSEIRSSLWNIEYRTCLALRESFSMSHIRCREKRILSTHIKENYPKRMQNLCTFFSVTDVASSNWPFPSRNMSEVLYSRGQVF